MSDVCLNTATTGAAVRPDVKYGGCEACSVRGDCQRLTRGLRKLLVTPVLSVRGSAESAYRSFVYLQESVNRRGLRYPNITDYRTCFFHDKPKLVEILRQRAEDLLSRAGFPVAVEPPGYRCSALRRGDDSVAPELLDS